MINTVRLHRKSIHHFHLLKPCFLYVNLATRIFFFYFTLSDLSFCVLIKIYFYYFHSYLQLLSTISFFCWAINLYRKFLLARVGHVETISNDFFLNLLLIDMCMFRRVIHNAIVKKIKMINVIRK